MFPFETLALLVSLITPCCDDDDDKKENSFLADSEFHVIVNGDTAVYIDDLRLTICENYEKRLTLTTIFLLLCSFDIRLAKDQSGSFNC